ncbi:MAG: hypothetical protein RL272_280 [Candidatus Parcubacteria bacterium]
MKTTAYAAAAALSLMLAAPAFAQGMMWRQGAAADSSAASAAQTGQDEAAGREIWANLKAGTVKCADLKDDDFDVLGDYFMGIMAGDTASHDAMNRAMTQRLGDAGEKQMHVIMGKRASGCDSSAAYPAGTTGYWPMMGGTVSQADGTWDRPAENAGFFRGGNMMYGNFAVAGFSPWFHWPMLVTMALVWIALVLAIIALLSWISKQKK